MLLECTNCFECYIRCELHQSLSGYSRQGRASGEQRLVGPGLHGPPSEPRVIGGAYGSVAITKIVRHAQKHVYEEGGHLAVYGTLPKVFLLAES